MVQNITKFVSVAKFSNFDNSVSLVLFELPIFVAIVSRNKMKALYTKIQAGLNVRDILCEIVSVLLYFILN